ncbi:MAG: hypothetical protein FJZ11_03470 [Candidatus Omnitrophica bacterium]|nr:hypothetical protein [Candidatus Omnitrophota bacterium]
MLVQIKNKKSATLIELIIMILVVAIIGATIAGAVIFFVQLFLYSPRQLDVQKIAQELSSALIEGDQNVRGIRYARKVIDASPTQFSYTYGYPTSDEQLSVRFRWGADVDDRHIYRSTRANGSPSWSTETVIPYYISSDITINSRNTQSGIFTYREADDSTWDSGKVNDIRRVIIDIAILTGTGSFGALEGAVNFTSSAEIKNFRD